MIIIPAGTLKYLLLDNRTLDRNSERDGRGAPAVVVAEMDGDRVISSHRGFNAHTSGRVTLTVFPRNHPLRANYHAAWTTDGEVELDADAAIPISPPAPPSIPATPARKSVKVKS